MADTVTISRPHFEALLRRAQFFSSHTGTLGTPIVDYVPVHNEEYESLKQRDREYNNLSNADYVPVHREEYDSLKQRNSEYSNLRIALLSGGLPAEALAILCEEGPCYNRNDRKDSGPGAACGNDHRPTPTVPPGLFPQSAVEVSAKALKSEYEEITPVASPVQHQRAVHETLTWQQQRDFGGFQSRVGFDQVADDLTGYGSEKTAQDAPYARHERRTIVITGLSDHITYKHLTEVIRGGRILYITITPDRRALVFMMEGAAEFINHVKRHDLYVQSKRLEVSWNDHQFALAPYVARRTAAGASRNLILRKAAKVPNVAENIREHMEHIHKFDIIDIAIVGHDVLVYTNSVHNALFARTCMISRKPYKGLTIDFLPDECAAPLRVPSNQWSRTPVETRKLTPNNVFEMLSLEDDSDAENRPPGREDDDDNIIDGDESSYSVSVIA